MGEEESGGRLNIAKWKMQSAKVKIEDGSPPARG
jgi:hypothetical protein